MINKTVIIGLRICVVPLLTKVNKTNNNISQSYKNKCRNGHL